MTNDEPLMDDDALSDAMLRYFDEHPELVNDVQPTRDLWPEIEGRIQARVLPLSTSAPKQVHTDSKVISMHASRRRFAWFPMTAAAAALVVATAGVTYVLTRRAAIAPATTPSVAAAAPSAQPAASSTPTATSPATIPSSNSTTDDDARVASNTPASGTSSSVTTSRSATARVREPHATVQLASNAGSVERDEMRADYDRDITTLRAALDARRAQLDPATVRTVEQNLDVIDNAIRQAKAALAKDPRSRFLNDQLDRSLAKKTDLLRAAALLPSA